jgi:hypothetical protein
MGFPAGELVIPPTSFLRRGRDPTMILQESVRDTLQDSRFDTRRQEGSWQWQSSSSDVDSVAVLHALSGHFEKWARMAPLACKVRNVVSYARGVICQMEAAVCHG